MENGLLIKIEIIILIFSFFYIIYYFGSKGFLFYSKVKNIVKPENKSNIKTALNKVNLNKKENNSKGTLKILSDKDKDKLFELIKRVKLNSTKGYFDIAKNLIVEGLSIDKYNKDLNLELAGIYEKEKNYINAEYIYKDLLEILKVDFRTMKKLGFVYALQNKFKESFDIYESIHMKKMSDDEVIDILSDLSFNLKKYKKALKYLNLHLAVKTRDTEKMFMKAKCLKVLGKDLDAISIYKRILELQPYNTRAGDKMKEIEDNINKAK